MDPTARYELRRGEWREDPPHVSYGSDRNGLVALLCAEMRAAPWTHGESDDGPVLEVKNRAIRFPPDAEDLKRLVGLARPAPYGRGEETLVDPDVRDALQIDAREVRFDGPSWARLQATMLESVAADMGAGARRKLTGRKEGTEPRRGSRHIAPRRARLTRHRNTSTCRTQSRAGRERLRRGR